MLELPEVTTIAKDLRKVIVGKIVKNVVILHSPHKFTFYNDKIEKMSKELIGKNITSIVDRNFYVEIEVEDYKIIMRDGANIRYHKDMSLVPSKHQLLIEFEDSSCITVTVAMYAFISVFKPDDFEDKYYKLELNGISPLDKKFTYEYFKSLLNEKTIKLSAKAFLATEQRILGIGNGVVQDILFNAMIHPKRKMNTLGNNELQELYNSIKSTLKEMIEQRGRDTEKDIYGNAGEYVVKLSKKTVGKPCTKCSTNITKENFLGGSIYYCSNCQKV